ILKEVMLETNTFQVNNDNYRALKENKSDIVIFKDGLNTLKVDFNEDDISIDGTLKTTKNLIIPNKSIVNIPNNDSYINGWFTGEFKSYPFQEYVINTTKIPLDSLFNNYIKSIELEV